MQILIQAPGGALRAVETQNDDMLTSICGLEPRTAHAAAHGGALRVVYGGRTLNPCSSLAAAGLPPFATLQLLPRLLGGGGDGGSTGAESRSCYLEMYMGKRPDKANPEAERRARWMTCQLSGMPLQPPCVADELGSLFNKDVVLQALLTKSMPKSLGHISSLKHLIELKLEVAAGGMQGPGDAASEGGARFACPITGQALNGMSKFVVVRRSGHVVSERAMKEAPVVVEELLGSKWEAADLLPINPSGDELQGMREQLLLKRAAERLAKKGKKSKDKAAAAVANDGGAAIAGASVPANGSAVVGDKRAVENGGKGGAAVVAVAAPNGAPAARGQRAKKFKAAEIKPKDADDKIWNSLFTSSTNNASVRNDYFCRAANRGA